MGESVGLDADGLGDSLAPPPVGGVTTVPLAKPFASTAMPPATSAKMITMRAVPRFTRPILP